MFVKWAASSLWFVVLTPKIFCCSLAKTTLTFATWPGVGRHACAGVAIDAIWARTAVETWSTAAFIDVVYKTDKQYLCDVMMTSCSGQIGGHAFFVLSALPLRMWLTDKTSCLCLLSQRVPSYPASQTHANWLTSSVQAPCTHGLLPHSLMFAVKRIVQF